MSSFRRRQMLAAAVKNVVGNILYQLTNHTCDGTGATCIDTGIKMLSQSFIQQHPKIRIEISYAGDQGNPSKAHIIRCNRHDDNYQGFYIRVNESDPNYCRIKLQISSVDEYSDICPTTAYNIAIIFDFAKGIFRVINLNQSGSVQAVQFQMAYSYENTPLTIGGSVINGVDASDGWKEMWSGTISSLVIKDLSIPPGPTQYISFDDPVVESICVQNFSSDGIGLTMQDAAAVTTLSENVFQGNTAIQTFDEFQYFTGLTSINWMTFRNCTNLHSVVLPNNLPNPPAYMFGNCERLKYLEIPASVTSLSDQFLSGATAEAPHTTILVFRGILEYCQNTAFWGRHIDGTIIWYVPYSADHSILSSYETIAAGVTGTPTCIELNPDGTIPS